MYVMLWGCWWIYVFVNAVGVVRTTEYKDICRHGSQSASSRSAVDPGSDLIIRPLTRNHHFHQPRTAAKVTPRWRLPSNQHFINPVSISHIPMSHKTPAKVLPIADILRDLAVLRASDTEIPETLLKSNVDDADPPSGTPSIVAESVANSYEYTRASRIAIKLHDSGKVDSEGGKIDHLRSKLEELSEVLVVSRD